MARGCGDELAVMKLGKANRLLIKGGQIEIEEQTVRSSMGKEIRQKAG